MGRITIYLPDDLAEDLEEIDNTSKFVQRAVKKELGYDPEEEEPEETLTNRLEKVEHQLELLRKETTKTKIADAVVGGDGPFNRRPKKWEELEETHK